jgi:hypothetical protein
VTQWRAQFLAFDAQVQTASGDVVEAFFRETATPKTLIALIEALEHEKLLVRYDARRLEEQILRHIDKHGVWKHQQGRRQPA